MKDRIYIQCGYEDMCKNKDCMKCGFKRRKYNLNLNLAECIVIEDFAMCDIKNMLKYKSNEVTLMQDIMKGIMHKVFKEEKK